jgi:uncharacterized protein (DUF849 family)
MTCDELMLFVVKQQKLTRSVVNCYEAGAFGFHLHRRFEELGIKNYVVQPQDWDERGNGVKNNRLDAVALCQPSRKKAVVAIARQLAVDLWRIFTGAAKAETFGLNYLPDAV